MLCNLVDELIVMMADRSDFSPEEYGPNYQMHLLEEYKLYVEMADRVSQRRALANSFFLALHTALFGLSVGLSGLSSGQIENQAAGLVASLFGFPFTYVWYRVLKSYRQLNSAKYKVVHELEAKLPVAPYDNEWEKAGRGKDPNLYVPLTVVEGWVPQVFAIGYLASAVLAMALIIWSLR